MKTILTKKAMVVVTLLLIVASNQPVKAQEGDMGIFETEDANVNPGGDPDVPLDGGLSILIAAGGAYVLRIKKAKKEGQKQ